MKVWCRLAAAFVIVGIILSPMRAAAATVPMLIAYDVAVPPMATLRVEAGPSLRSELGGVPKHVYDGARFGDDGPSKPPVAAGAGAVHAYDNALELAERREAANGVIYAAPAATTAAEGTTALPALRQAYVADVRNLEDVGLSARAGGQSTPDTARMLVDMRNQLKLDYRALSPADAVKAFEERNALKYGNPLGPSADQLLLGGKTWEQIIDGAATPGGADLGF